MAKEKISPQPRFEHFPRLENLPDSSFPKHFAIIPDGNRRWAKAHKLEALRGHDNGRGKALELIRHLKELPIDVLSFWAFSSDNWKRDDKEVAGLMKIINGGLRENMDELIADQSRFIHIGRKDRIPQGLRKTLEELEDKSSSNAGKIVVMAIDFGGVDQTVRIVQNFMADSVKEFAEEVDSDRSSTLKPAADIFIAKKKQEIDVVTIQRLYDGKGLIEPADLLIRTSGEKRTSDIGWVNGASTEIYFIDENFPEINNPNIEDAILEFSKRQRRLGK